MKRCSDQATERRRGTDGALGVRPGRMPGIPRDAAQRAQPRRPQSRPAGRHAADRTGFSLIELLLAVFILGIGVISIAALFPAGIAQQRQSVDDVIGPIVANNALAILRSKLKVGDFGFMSPSPTIEGDFGWSRPAFFLQDTSLSLPDGNNIWVPAGSIDIFSQLDDDGLPDTTNSEVLQVPGATTDPIIITQGERYYPMRALADPVDARLGYAGNIAPRAQYVWDCMFRRFQGKILVAIFVYRVNMSGGETASYIVAPGASGISPLPAAIDLTAALGGAWDANVRMLPGTDPNTPFTLYTPVSVDDFFALDPALNQGWQVPSQWLLDQNNNVHRVLSGRQVGRDGPVELVRSVARMPRGAIYFFPSASAEVGTIWYIPPQDSRGLMLTPVYVTVREL